MQKLARSDESDLIDSILANKSAKKTRKYKVGDKVKMIPADSTLYSNGIKPGDKGVVEELFNNARGDEYIIKIDHLDKPQLIHADFFELDK